MANNQGILSDENGDLMIKNGTFVVGNTEEVEIRRILLSAKGGYYYEPLMGVDLQRKLGQSTTQAQLLNFKAEVAEQLRNDGFTVNDISFDAEGNIRIDAERS